MLIHYYTDKSAPAELLIEQSIQDLLSNGHAGYSERQLVIRFTHAQYYLPGQPFLDLLGLIQIYLDSDGAPAIEGSVLAYTSELLEHLRELESDDGALKRYSHNYSLPWLVLSDPWKLSPVYIPKPWGQEIWYTGIEARGQASVDAGTGNILLPWLLELMPQRVGLENDRQPTLLKVLDPIADEVYGDLYFELHEEKQEVYVVTHVDQMAWPKEVGAIQLGFAYEKRQLFSSDDEFKQAYLSAVKEYEQVRRALDEKLDLKKLEDGINSNQPVAVDKLKGWIKELSQSIENKELFHKEVALREVMDGFIAKCPLAVGDVVIVPRLVPHALQHGVRVVEFQTPVYERKILSFAQKVLTQDHWDTEDALSVANMDFSTLQPPEVLSSNAQLSVERIVNFDDFEVRRIQLEGDYLLTSNDYSLVMVVQGSLEFKNAGRMDKYDAGQALLVPKTARGWSVSGSNSCIFLITSPH